jgi:hypothetical protein
VKNIYSQLRHQAKDRGTAVTDATKLGLLLKNQFPHIDIKVCGIGSIEEGMQGTVLH